MGALVNQSHAKKLFGARGYQKLMNKNGCTSFLELAKEIIGAI